MMAHWCVVIACALFGIGLGTVLFRRNFLGIALGGLVAGTGMVLALAAIAREAAQPADGILLAIFILVFQLAATVGAVSVLHRRYVLGAPIDSTEEGL